MSGPIRIGITMGDPGGVGPEVVVKALSDYPASSPDIEPVIIGDFNVIEAAAASTKSDLNLSCINRVDETCDGIGVLNLTDLDPAGIAKCRVDLENGRASLAYIKEAVNMALAGKLDAIVTAPISKAAIKMAGCHHSGHTGLIAEMTNADKHVMMLAGSKLRVALITTHIPLKSVPAAVTIEAVIDTVEVTCTSLKRLFGIDSPKLAVAAINPHAGEDGTLGDEEIKVLQPALENLKAKGIDVSGPYPADSLYYFAAKGKYDAVISPYHDQGLVALKLLHFEDGVNITLGLPIIRTSPDHGTAFDIAWKNQACPMSMISAIKLAASLAKNKIAGNGGREEPCE